MPPFGIGAADESHLIAFELEADASPRRFGHVQFSARDAGGILDRPISFVLQPVVLGHLLRIVAFDEYAFASIVANRDDAIAVRKRLDGIAVFRKRFSLCCNVLPSAETDFGTNASRSTSSLGARRRKFGMRFFPFRIERS